MRAFLLESQELCSRSFTKYLWRLTLAKIPTDEASFQTNHDLGRKEMLNAFSGLVATVSALVESANLAPADAETDAPGTEA